jgi:hypothetical protein
MHSDCHSDLPEVMNLDQGFRGYRPRMSSNCASRSMSYLSRLQVSRGSARNQQTTD